MSTDVSTATNTTHHPEHLADRAAMLAMRTVIALQPKADLGPKGRAAFGRADAKDSVRPRGHLRGGERGRRTRLVVSPPFAAELGAVILYLHGGAYVVGSARAYRHFAGQIASRANAPAFVTDYGLAPERPFPAAVEDAGAAYRGLASAGFSQILLKKSETGVPRKSRCRAYSVACTGSCHSEA